MHNIISMTLTEAFMISSRVKHFVLQANASPAFQWIPGQFITIQFERDGKILKRSYSLANAADGNNKLEFAAGYVESGPGTDYLFNLKPGDEMNVTGPFGRLVLKEDLPRRYILVATSTGITPYRAMLPELEKRLKSNQELSVVILEGVRQQEDLLYHHDFESLAEKFPAQVKFIPCFSGEEQTNLHGMARSGYVQHAFNDIQLNPENDFVYLCGNPCMIDEAFQYLQINGFAVQQIIREKYISR